jgi:hypothetical protein
MLHQWREEYADEPLPKRQGLTARQIFDEGKGAGLDPKALYFLMMVCEIKTVRRNRFTFAGVDWEGSCLYGYKDKILIRYLLSDLSQIYVFDPRDQFMGIVTQTSKADPIKDWQAAKRIIAERHSFKRQTKKLADFIREKPFVIEGRKDPDLIEYIEAEEAKTRPKQISPFIDDNAPQAVNVAPVEVRSGAVSTGEPGKPWFYDDYEKYDYLMAQKEISQEDQNWIEDFRSRSSLYKYAQGDER